MDQMGIYVESREERVARGIKKTHRHHFHGAESLSSVLAGQRVAIRSPPVSSSENSYQIISNPEYYLRSENIT